jgi:hypothetical protein
MTSIPKHGERTYQRPKVTGSNGELIDENHAGVVDTGLPPLY